MKKVGIITLNGYFNYGNRLQNYALQEMIKSLGFKVETIRIERFGSKSRFFKKMGPILNIVKPNKIRRIEQEREKIFKEFSNNYIAESKQNYNLNYNFATLNKKYDYFVVGSDQVWNPSMNKESPVFFAGFADKSKRIAYSASFGISKIPEHLKGDYTEWLNDFKYISVREQEGANIVEDLTNRIPKVLVDPTMLLSDEEWISISKKAENRPNKPYILTYFLGGPNEKDKAFIQSVAAKNNMEVINLGDNNEFDSYTTGPSEFIDYINNASAFFTDSFHGVVFSIILHTPFLVYERQSSGSSMYSRIETILEKFHMEDRAINDFSGNIFDMDFESSKQILDKERANSIDYLKNSLSSK